MSAVGRIRHGILLALCIPIVAWAQYPGDSGQDLYCDNPVASHANLYGYAQGYAAARSYRFGQGAEQDFRRATEAAARELAPLPGAACARRAFEAKLNIQRFIDAMISAARADPFYSKQNPGIIGEQTIFQARRGLCPIWPFC